ncbi:unnamed protein product [Spirodela intermedia]|uniref:Uncharacterized protein n=1 Tax=Spirodela intermedia TaxID=51605 RepID=A0A7I8L1R9_SPIIN|nr:unnamed protein product [Spirodela intermedia]
MGQCASRRAKGGRNWWESSPSASETNGCLAVAKEQRSRFYIIRRCVVMLLCWHKYGKYG